MKTPKPHHLILSLLAGFCFFLQYPSAIAAEPSSSLPPIVQSGFDSWAKGGGIDGALYLWQKGGLLDGDRRVSDLGNRLRRISQALGNYGAYEVLKSDPVGRSSQVLYLTLNFQRGAVFARFVLYRTEKAWVVQDMDFSTRPEAIMPWLSFAGERTSE